MSNPAKPSLINDTDRDLLWKQYQVHVDMYRFYMEQLLKMQVFYYGITSAVATYIFTESQSEAAKYSLLLPLLMSLAFAGFYYYGAKLNHIARNDVFNIRDTLGLEVAPDIGVLSVILYIFAALTLIVALGCIYILFSGVPIPHSSSSV